jgi:hypothetical protein
MKQEDKRKSGVAGENGVSRNHDVIPLTPEVAALNAQLRAYDETCGRLRRQLRSIEMLSDQVGAQMSERCRNLAALSGIDLTKTAGAWEIDGSNLVRVK